MASSSSSRQSSSSSASPRGIAPPQSSRRASSSSPSPTFPLARKALGTALGPGTSSLTLPGISLAPGSLLVVVAGVLGSSDPVTLTFRGVVLVPQGRAVVPVGSPLAGSVSVFSDWVSGGKVGDLVLHPAGGNVATLTLQAAQVSGLPLRAPLTQAAAAQGLGTFPDTGAAGVPLMVPNYAQAAFALAALAGWSWAGGFASGGQDQTPSLGGVAAGVTEGYRLSGGLDAPRATLAASAPGWAGALVTYR